MPRGTDVFPRMEPGEITFQPIPLYRYQASLADELKRGLSPDVAVDMLRTMHLIRLFESMIAELKGGKFQPLPDFKYGGATHLSIGQEAVAVGAISAIRPDDYITSTHRGHGHSLAKGVFFLKGADRATLARFAEVPEDTPDLGAAALQMHLFRMVAELFGRERGYCRGRGGSMHIADFHSGHLGANAIVGGSVGIATGAAWGTQALGTDRIVLCLVGDGGANNGIFHESVNFASMGQFERGVPVIYCIENNQYAMSGQEAGEVTGIRHLAQRGAAYRADNLHAEVVDGMNVLAVRDAVLRAAQLCREGNGPVLLDCMTYRYMGHSLSDPRMTYRSEEEEAAWQRLDPVPRFEEQLIGAGILTPGSVQDLREQTRRATERAAVDAAQSPDPDPAQIYEGLYACSSSADVGEAWRTTPAARQANGALPRALPWAGLARERPLARGATPQVFVEPKKTRRDSRGQILYRHAVAEAILEEMLRDRRVVFYGEDVADYGGAFQATPGLLKIFGRNRVFNTGISEAAIIGTGTGAAMVGMRPVVEIMYIDFMLQAGDQLANQAAKTRYMFGGKALIPLTIRTTVGGGKGYAGQHSQSLEALCCMFPGLKVVAPSTPYDVKGLLKASIRDDNPVVFIEHQLLYTLKGEVPEEEYTVPLGQAAVRREGTDVTVVAYSYWAQVAREAAELVAEEGLSVEMIDPRTLVPLDIETIARSVAKTGRLLLVTQAPLTGCFSEHIAYAVQERCFESLHAPIKILAAHEVPPPMSAVLEAENLPSVEKVAGALRELACDLRLRRERGNSGTPSLISNRPFGANDR